MIRVLVTGSREFTDASLAEQAIFQAAHALGYPFVVVHGGARGADRLLETVAQFRRLPTHVFLPQWDKHGKAAGFIRNQEMVDSGADLCIAFLVEGLPCRGTHDCAERALNAGIPVWYYTQGAGEDD